MPCVPSQGIRRSGKSAVEYISQAQIGKLTLQHVREYHCQLDLFGIESEIQSPLLLPDYVREEVKQRSYI